MWIRIALLLVVVSLPLVAEVAPVPTTDGGDDGQGERFSDEWWRTTDTGDAPSTSSTDRDIGPAVTRLIIALVVVVVVLLASAWGVRRLGLNRRLTAQGRHMEVIDQLALGPKRAVSLLRIGDQLLVVGSGEHEVHQLAQLPASVLDDGLPVQGKPLAEAMAAARAESGNDDQPHDESASPAASFGATLRRLLGRRDG